MQPTETDTGSLVRRTGARAAVGHLNHLHSDGELAATPRRTGAARTQKSVVITTNLFSRPHRHSYGPRGAGVSRRAAYACGLSACTRPSRARMKSAEKIRDFVCPPYLDHVSCSARAAQPSRKSQPSSPDANPVQEVAGTVVRHGWVPLGPTERPPGARQTCFWALFQRSRANHSWDEPLHLGGTLYR